MKILILNGNPYTNGSAFDLFIDVLNNELRKNHSVHTFVLRKLNIKACIGCFDCWVKTPGICVFIDRDESLSIYQKYIQSDLVLFASPLLAGFTSALLKKITDRLIPLLHPYFELVNGELHHKKRYKDYPKIGLVFSTEPDTNPEVLKTLSYLYQRFALNFKSTLEIFHATQYPVKKLIDEINHI